MGARAQLARPGNRGDDRILAPAKSPVARGSLLGLGGYAAAKIGRGELFECLSLSWCGAAHLLPKIGLMLPL